jgi:hypothetical protein
MMHPSMNGVWSIHAARQWRSNYEGRVNLLVTIMPKYDSCGDGYTFRVFQNRALLLSETVPAVSKVTITLPQKVDLKFGDTLDFVQSPNVNEWCDAMEIDIRITEFPHLQDSDDEQ